MKALLYITAFLAAAPFAETAESQFDDRPDMIELLADGKIRARPEDTSLLMNIGAVYTGLATIAGCEIEILPEGIDLDKLQRRFRAALSDRLDLAVVMSPGSPLLAAHPNGLRVAALAASRGCRDAAVQRLLVETVMVIGDYRNEELADQQNKTGVPLSQEKTTPLNPRFIGGVRSQRDAGSEAELEAIQNARIVTARSGQRVLSCNYGPKNADGTGFTQADFWHESLPPFSHDEMLRIGPNNELANIPYVALDACPATEEEAFALRREHALPHPSPVAFDPTFEVPRPAPGSEASSQNDPEQGGSAAPDRDRREAARSQRATPAVPEAPEREPESDGPPSSIAGRYSVEGRNPDGSTYSGALRVLRVAGDIHEFRWSIAGQSYMGRGAWKDGRISVDYGDQYPAVYNWNEDGYLDGTWAGGSGKEKLTPRG